MKSASARSSAAWARPAVRPVRICTTRRASTARRSIRRNSSTPEPGSPERVANSYMPGPLFAVHKLLFPALLAADMIRVHHLNNSRSQRVLWLLEETGTPYEIVRYERDKKTMLAPKELRRVHPLGKSPVVEDDGRTLAETGLIVDYLVERFGTDLAPVRDSELYWRYKYWLHYAEGSLMPPLLLI